MEPSKNLRDIYDKAFYDCRFIDGGRDSFDECHTAALFAVYRIGIHDQLSLSSSGNLGTPVPPATDNAKLA